MWRIGLCVLIVLKYIVRYMCFTIMCDSGVKNLLIVGEDTHMTSLHGSWTTTDLSI
jgi:hypothetical protein